MSRRAATCSSVSGCVSVQTAYTKVPPGFTACATFSKWLVGAERIGELFGRGAPAGIWAASPCSPAGAGRIHEDAVV